MKELKEFTKQEIIAEHRSLWNWLSITGANDKKSWPEWGRIEREYGNIDIPSNCFACYFGELNQLSCNKCLLDWGDIYDCTDGSLYRPWYYSSDNVERMELAKLIRDLSVRDEYKDEV